MIENLSQQENPNSAARNRKVDSARFPLWRSLMSIEDCIQLTDGISVETAVQDPFAKICRRSCAKRCSVGSLRWDLCGESLSLSFIDLCARSLYKVSIRDLHARSLKEISQKDRCSTLCNKSLSETSVQAPEKKTFPGKIFARDLYTRSSYEVSIRNFHARSPCNQRSLFQLSIRDLLARSL